MPNTNAQHPAPKKQGGCKLIKRCVLHWREGVKSRPLFWGGSKGDTGIDGDPMEELM